MTQSGHSAIQQHFAASLDQRTGVKNIDWGKSVAIVANIGVIFGLVLLAVELNQNNEVLEAQSRDVWVDRRAAILEKMALNPELLELLLKAANTSEPLSNLELRRVRAIGFRTFAIWQHQFTEMRRGRLTESEVMSLQRAVFHTDGNDLGTRLVWEDYKTHRASADYRSWFEENIVVTQ